MIIKVYHQVNHRGENSDAFYISVIDDKDGHILLPLLMFTCTILHHTLREWQWNKGIHPKGSKSKFKVDSPDPSNYFNYQNDCGNIASGCAVTSRHKLTFA